jgi:hypothetical protein
VELSTITRSCGEFPDARIIESTTYSDDLELSRPVAAGHRTVGGHARPIALPAVHSATA